MDRFEDYDYTFIISVVGAPKTGKSSLVDQYISPDLFVSSKTDYIPTIGFDFRGKSIHLDGNFFKNSNFRYWS